MPSKDPAKRLGHIIDNIDRVFGHIEGVDRNGFLADPMRIDAVKRCLQRISEAARKLGPDMDTLRLDVDWRAIRSLGNVLRHDYETVVEGEIWRMVERDLKPLRDACEAELKKLGDC